MSKIVTLLKSPKEAISYKYNQLHTRFLKLCLSDKVYPHLSDKKAISVKYEWLFGKKLDLNDPKTFNEKLQWLKLYDRNPLYTTLVDKAEVKKWVAEKIGEEYVIPTYGVYDSADEIDFDALPDRFVLKGTHDSASVIFCNDKNTFDREDAKKRLSECLKKSQFLYGREWPYKNVKPRIIAEPYLVDESGEELKDYKVCCFNGKAEYLDLHFARFSQHKKNHYDFDWNPLFFSSGSPTDYSIAFEKPERLDDIKRVSEILSKEITFLRVDFYIVYDRVYVGEVTFFPGSGFNSFDPPIIDYELGEKLVLPEKRTIAK